MENINVPYQVKTVVSTFQGDWTAEQIDAGLADEHRKDEVYTEWYEPSKDGPKLVTDPVRIAELEASIA